MPDWPPFPVPYSQSLGASGDVFGHDVDPQAVTVHRAAQAPARRRTRAPAARQQQQDGPRQRRPHPSAPAPGGHPDAGSRRLLGPGLSRQRLVATAELSRTRSAASPAPASLYAASASPSTFH